MWSCTLHNSDRERDWLPRLGNMRCASRGVLTQTPGREGTDIGEPQSLVGRPGALARCVHFNIKRCTCVHRSDSGVLGCKHYTNNRV
jgi:hypothetical protein